MLPAVLLAAGLCHAATTDGGGIVFQRTVTLTSERVTLADLADVSVLPTSLRKRAAKLEIAAFRPGQTRLVLRGEAVVLRAGALIPALSPWLKPGFGQSITVSLVRPRRIADGHGADSGCLVLSARLPAGAIAVSTDFAPSACGARASIWAGALRYDANVGAMRASRDIAAGEVAPAMPSFAVAAIRPGQTLYLSTRIGDVIVERGVEAVQVGHPGGRVFVRAKTGPAFSVPTPEGRQ